MPRPLRAALVAGSLATLALTGGALAQPPGGRGPGGPGGGSGLASAGEPSDLISAESQLARLIAQKGQAEAWRAMASFDAQVILPGQSQPVLVQAWAKGRKPATEPEHRRIRGVWISCDGSAGITHGIWQSGTAHGWYATVWERQPKGGYLWVLDQGGPLGTDVSAEAGTDAAEPEWITGKVAECPARPKRGGAGGPSADGKGHKPDTPSEKASKVPVDHLSGLSRDKTLDWSTTKLADGRRQLSVRARVVDGQMAPVLSLTAR